MVRPYIPMLEENNVRSGFFEREQFESVRRHLPEELRAVITFAYFTGWRINSEILTLEWSHVDLKAGAVRLNPGTTKNKEGRLFPFKIDPELTEVLETQKAKTDALQKEQGMIWPWIFHRTGQPIKDYRKTWEAACKKAGVPGRIPHDFRRTAVRKLERAGVSRSVAMKRTGHRTEAVYRRYAIVSEADLSESGG
jgi:integrase